MTWFYIFDFFLVNKWIPVGQGYPLGRRSLVECFVWDGGMHDMANHRHGTYQSQYCVIAELFSKLSHKQKFGCLLCLWNAHGYFDLEQNSKTAHHTPKQMKICAAPWWMWSAHGNFWPLNSLNFVSGCTCLKIGLQVKIGHRRVKLTNVLAWLP